MKAVIQMIMRCFLDVSQYRHGHKISRFYVTAVTGTMLSRYQQRFFPFLSGHRDELHFPAFLAFPTSLGWVMWLSLSHWNLTDGLHTTSNLGPQKHPRESSWLAAFLHSPSGSRASGENWDSGGISGPQDRNSPDIGISVWSRATTPPLTTTDSHCTVGCMRHQILLQ